MKSGMPYKKRLYGLVFGVLCLCCVLSIVGMTVVNGKGIQHDIENQITKLEKNTARNMSLIERDELDVEECTYQSALKIVQLGDSVIQGDFGISYACSEDDEIVVDSTNIIFLHFYESFLDDDGDTVYDESLQLLLDLEQCLSDKEIKTVKDYVTCAEDAVVIADGTYDGIYLNPTRIQVLAPTEEQAKNDWKSDNGYHILTDQDYSKFHILWEKEIDNSLAGENLPKNITIESEAYFDENTELSAVAMTKMKKSKKQSSLWDVTRAGMMKTGANTKINYCYTANPLKKAISQLGLVYVVMLLFYIVAAAIVYTVMHMLFEKQEQWNWSQKMLTRAIAHELKTPLSIIQGYCEGMKVQQSPEKREEYLETITEETKEMDRLVLDMLELSKLETGGYEIEPEELHLSELINVILRQYKSIYEEKNITVNIQVDEEFCFEGDLSCMHKVLSNLISNAIKHAPMDGKIDIVERKEKDKFFLGIANNGPQIEESVRKHIWDGYHRADKNNKSRIRSTGLGLTIVKYMLDLQGFSYGCDNKEIGVEFWLKLS